MAASFFLWSLWASLVESLSMEVFRETDIGREFTWSEVNRVHRSRNGVYQKNGELVSLLTDLGRISKCYPDVESEDGDLLFYTGAGRRGDQKLDVHNRALHDAIRTEKAVPLFCKHAVNRWEYMGLWSVEDAEYVFEEKNERMVWRFALRKQHPR